MSKIKIAIIDSGIEESSYSLNKNIIGLYNFVDNEKFDNYGHGTMCYKLINDSLIQCQDVSFYIIKVFSYIGQTKSTFLIEALEVLIELDVDLINLSLSLSNLTDVKIVKRIADLCTLLKSQNKVIICSAMNGNKTINSFPANLDSTIGVEGAIFNSNKYWFNCKYEIQAVADQTPVLIQMQNQKLQFFTGNSKSTALFTRIVANEIVKVENKISVDDVSSLLLKNAERRIWTCKDIENTYQKDRMEPYEDINNNKNNKEIKNKLIVFMKKIGRDFDIEEKEWGMHVIDDILSNLFDLELILDMKFNYSNIIFDDFRNIDTLASAIILRWSNK